MTNRFDESAATWDDDPTRVRRAQVIAEAIRAAVPLRPSTRLLEYGAGTGLVAQILAEHVGAITLAEPSEGMRTAMRDKVGAGVLPTDARIWDLDLGSSDAPDARFDLVVTVLALHHVHDTQRALDGFAALLDDGGTVAIVDLDTEDGSFHDPDSGFDGHHGFDRAALTTQLTAARFSDVRFEQCYQVEKAERLYPLFLATASRIPRQAP